MSKSIVPIAKLKFSKKFAERKERPLNMKQKKEVKRIANAGAEIKFQDALSGVNQTYGSGVGGTLLSDLTAVAAANRVGIQIVPFKLRLHMSFLANTAASALFQALTRILVFQWRPNNTVAPTIANIFDNGPSGAPDVWSSTSHGQRHLFTVLYDRLIDQSVNLASSNVSKEITKTISLYKKAAKVNFDTGAVTTGDHHIYMLIMGSNPQAAANQSMTLNVRTFYRDE